jgi:phospholipid/cholesterol/gamma-HCH transport system substrate-binding protein
VQSKTPVTEGTRAMLNVRGLTGISYISLKDKGEDLMPLHALKGHDWPIVPTEPSLFLQMDAALGKLNENVSAATKSIRALLSPANLREVAAILKNLHSLSDSLIRDDEQFGEILNNTAAASREFPGMVSNLNQALSNFLNISDQIRQNPALMVRGRAQPAAGPGEK